LDTPKRKESLTFHETLIPVAAIIIAFIVPFVLRGLNKGEKNVTTTTNVFNLKTDVSNLEKAVDKMTDMHHADMQKINETFSTISGDMKLHTNFISQVQLDISRLEERLRSAEIQIIRNERRINGGARDEQRR
jgi:hypothetical protein